MERCDSEILKVTSDELIAKEAHYHASCYRDYVRPSNETLATPEQNKEEDLSAVFKYLEDLQQNPKCVDLKCIQALLTTESGRKNIRRTIERKTDAFTFVKCGTAILVYPNSWKTEDIVAELWKAQMKVLSIEKSNEPQSIVYQSGSIVRNEVKSMEYTMPWPPSPEDLNVFNFQLPTYLDSFLSILLSGNINMQSERVNRLKLSFAQDVIYAGIKKSVYFLMIKHSYTKWTNCLQINFSLFFRK